jgi:hypothetical protein
MIETIELLRQEVIKIPQDSDDKNKEISRKIEHLRRLRRLQGGGVYLDNPSVGQEIHSLSDKIHGYTYNQLQLMTKLGFSFILDKDTLKKFKYAASFYADDRCSVGNHYHKLIYTGDVPDFILDRISQLETLPDNYPDIFAGHWEFAIVSTKALPMKIKEIPTDPCMVGFFHDSVSNPSIVCDRDKHIIEDIENNYSDKEGTKDFSSVLVGIWFKDDEITI